MMSTVRRITRDEAAALLRLGEMIAIPTDTVYGLVSRLDAPEAIAQIYELKDRPPDKALIALVASAEQAKDIVADWPEGAQRLAQAFWPGALTIVLPKSKAVSGVMSGGMPTIGVRMPAHEAVLRLLEESGPAASTSANRSGSADAVCVEDVEKEFAGEDLCVLDGGACEGGVASTVVEIVEGDLVVHRAGAISEAQLREAIEG
jgi:L-threonylcarbamoyladenylate synthase